MIDNIRIICPLETLPKEVDYQLAESFFINDIQFNPDIKNGFRGWYHGRIRNLDLKVHGYKLHIRNSLHKYVKGNNYSDFRFSELKESLEDIESRLSLPLLAHGEIKSLEVGCNIEYKAQKEYENWLYYKGDSPKPIYNYANGKDYGKQFVKSDYKIKIYDKTFETLKHYGVQLQKEITRYEVKTGHMRHLNQRSSKIGVYVVNDLLNPLKMRNITNDAMNKYKTIEKRSIEIPQSLEDRKILGTMLNKSLRESIERDFPRSYKEYKMKLKKISAAYPSENISGLLEDKFNELLDT